MNITRNETSATAIPCVLKTRVYSPDYLFFKLLSSTYVRLIVGPGILLNFLCILVLTRPRLANKSTTIVFLRFLAVFDILAIGMKYIRAELNYQSIGKHKHLTLVAPETCKAIYVLMNAFTSMAMWTIVLMSLDKAVAVSYPLKSSIWVTQKRAVYICCVTSVALFLANLSFINLSDVLLSVGHYKYCGLTKDSLIVDILTASILPIGLITGANIVIAIVLHRVSRKSFNWSASEERKSMGESETNSLTQPSSPSLRLSSSVYTCPRIDRSQATKRRASAQVTRMLLAVTLSLILFNIPNTLIFLLSKIYDIRQLLFGRSCQMITDRDIRLYQIGFYSSVIQDILSDLPHVVNFFLYCLAGKKFRSIFVNEVKHFLVEVHLLQRPPKASARQDGRTTVNMIESSRMAASPKKTTRVVFNGSNNRATIQSQHSHRTSNGSNRDKLSQRAYSSID